MPSPHPACGAGPASAACCDSCIGECCSSGGSGCVRTEGAAGLGRTPTPQRACTCLRPRRRLQAAGPPERPGCCLSCKAASMSYLSAAGHLSADSSCVTADSSTDRALGGAPELAVLACRQDRSATVVHPFWRKRDQHDWAQGHRGLPPVMWLGSIMSPAYFKAAQSS
jgi:hypothetical protein